MPYRILKDVSCRDVNDDPQLHKAGTVVSDWEISKFVKDLVNQGTPHYRSIFEPLTEKQALDHRAKETSLEGDRLVDGHHVSAPWEDYVGLHPTEVIQRMHDSNDRNVVAQVRLYERGGLARTSILEYLAPVEREPFYGYDDMGIRDVMEKLDILSPEAVQETISYEMAHRKRPAIINYEREQEAVAA